MGRSIGSMKIILISLIAVSSLLAGCSHDAKTPDEVQAVNDYAFAESGVNSVLKTLEAIAKAEQMVGPLHGYESNMQFLYSSLARNRSRAETAKEQLQSMGVKIPTDDDADAMVITIARNATIAANAERDRANAIDEKERQENADEDARGRANAQAAQERHEKEVKLAQEAVEKQAAEEAEAIRQASVQKAADEIQQQHENEARRAGYDSWEALQNHRKNSHPSIASYPTPEPTPAPTPEFHLSAPSNNPDVNNNDYTGH
jgi:hypothetical protein